jgi:diguanylate cyclase (GGDEF)-like protein
MLGRLRGLDTIEERALAGKLAGTLWLTGAVTAVAGLYLPGAETRHWEVVVALASLGALWGIACFTLIPWERAHPLVFHLSAFLGFPITAGVVAATGGAGSPGAFYLLFIAVYCSYFYRPVEAAPYLAGCVLVHALPLLYDHDFATSGFANELVILAPTYVVLGGLIIRGKRNVLDLRERAQRLSLADPLTGLSNRRAFTDRMAERLGGERQTDSTGLLLVDLDDFKDANTLHGHAGGDRVLCEVSAALREAVRGEDLIARLGGDEFAVIAHGVSAESMRLLVGRVMHALQRADERLAMSGYSLTASAGWALYPDDASTQQELFAAADVSLRGAKVNGKNRAHSPLDWAPRAASA